MGKSEDFVRLGKFEGFFALICVWAKSGAYLVPEWLDQKLKVHGRCTFFSAFPIRLRKFRTIPHFRAFEALKYCCGRVRAPRIKTPIFGTLRRCNCKLSQITQDVEQTGQDGKSLGLLPPLTAHDAGLLTGFLPRLVMYVTVPSPTGAMRFFAATRTPIRRIGTY